jgi:hypothetical protein
MLHITKLAVGVTDIAHLQSLQAARLQRDPPLRHWTRNSPRRIAEVIDGGSMYWVISGAMLVRQRILDIVPGTRDDGSACVGFVFDPTLIPVEGRPTKPFQGWRYLTAADAPADLTRAAAAIGADRLPPQMAAELRALGLL